MLKGVTKYQTHRHYYQTLQLAAKELHIFSAVGGDQARAFFMGGCVSLSIKSLLEASLALCIFIRFHLISSGVHRFLSRLVLC